MLKRLKLKSLLPSSALRSNSAALRLSKTPPQGGVFVSGAELFPGWRLTPYPGYKCSKASLRAANPKHRTRRSPGQQRATGGQTLPVPQTGHQPPRHRSGRQNQIPHLPVAPVSDAPPGDKRCQCRRPAISPPRHRSGRQNPNTALARSPGQQRATGGQTVSVPQTGHQPPKASLRAAKTEYRTRRSPGQQRATGGQTLPVPQNGHQPPKGIAPGDQTQTPHPP